MRWGVLGLAVGVTACVGTPPVAERGLEVSAVEAGGVAERAGLLAGDRVVAYTPDGGAAQEFRSCFDVRRLESELAPRGPGRLLILRRAAPMELAVRAGFWDFEVKPPDDGTAISRCCRLLSQARAAWTGLKLDQASELYGQAALAAEESGEPLALAAVRRFQGVLALDRSDLATAEQRFLESLALVERVNPESLAVATAWHSLGLLAQRRGDFQAADAAFSRELVLRERLAPEHLDHAWALANLGINAFYRQDLTTAEGFYRRAHELTSRIAPESLELAGMTSNLGLLARVQGRLEEARERLLAAAELLARVEPEGDNAQRNRVNLATLAMDRGDLAEAEALHHQALAWFERRGEESLAVAQIFENLGIMARQRGELSEAEPLLTRAWELRQKLASGPRSQSLSASLLAWVLLRRGRTVEAENLARQALELAQAVPETERVLGEVPEALGGLQVLAEAAGQRGALAEALTLAERVVRWRRARQPASLRLANSLQLLGRLRSESGNNQAAEQALGESIALFERQAPESFFLAEAWSELGQHRQRLDQLESAAAAYRQAVAALEAQLTRLGGSEEALVSYQLKDAELDRRLVALELELGRPWKALEALERSRGRSLKIELFRRALTLAPEVPAQLAAEQARLDRAYDQAQQRLAAGREGGSGGGNEETLAELATLRSRRAAWRERLAQTSPRVAALAFGGVDPERLWRQLPAGTVALSYSVGEAETLLFVLRSAADQPEAVNALRAHRLAVGRSELAREVALFRSLLLAGRAEPETTAPLRAAGAALSSRLLGPAAAELQGVSRLLLAPDGPLHLLPFAALVGPSGRFWAEDWVLSHALSSGLAVELAGEHLEPAKEPPRGYAFVAPLLPPPPATGAAGASALARFGLGLAPLPGTREEARVLLELLGRGVDVAVGREANEARVKQLPKTARFLHFGCHGLLDPSSPLDSGLALAPSPEAGENGLLQAWEILARLRVSTPLATLSACETGIGAEGGGEGLQSLARAFQFAGARAVVASQWRVADRSTAQLMAELYRRWLSGERPDEALAHAQRALLASGGAAAHPYAWAGFQLAGDGGALATQ